MKDIQLHIRLSVLERDINDIVDILIIKRDVAVNGDKQDYRYVTRKLEQALGSINKALDRVNQE